MDKQNIITGLWKFHERVPEQQLIDQAIEWSADSRYTQLYIRKVAKDQYGIGFMYDILDATDAKSVSEAFFDDTTDILKRKFGNDLVGWDIGYTTIIIK